MYIHELFFKTAQCLPDAEALLLGETSLTYGQCAMQVESLARGLSEYLPHGARVAINTYKSPETILMMLACLHAGLTYVPIDPTSPIVRRRFILKDSKADALVLDARTVLDWKSENDMVSSLRLLVGPSFLHTTVAHHVTIQELMTEHANITHVDLVRPLLTGNELAYILYTSGSTGEPKGVMITHLNAAAFVEWGMIYFDLHIEDRVAVHAPLHFDLPVFDIYVSLAQGATVCLIDEKTVLFPQAVLRFLQKMQITVLYAVPSALTALVNHSTLADGNLSTLRLLLYAGEEFHPAPLAKLMKKLPHVRFFNLYGPIETNVVTAFEVKPEHIHYQRIPIGQPVFNTQIFLLNLDGHVVEETDKEGEILVSGPSVTPGYLGRAELTAKSRIEIRCQEHRLVCYRTGDFAQWDEQGILHFLGRRDALIKTRGFRVDLGDVEATLMTYPDLAEACVVAKPHSDYTNLLYAFVVPKPGASVEEETFLTWLRSNLPSYMVPHRFTVCDKLPKTSTGKIARRQLICK